jgi:uncharacterized alkaline shock family protein YloU
MIFLKRFAILIYVTLLLFFSCGLLMFTLHKLEPNFVHGVLDAIYADKGLRIIFGILSVVLLFLNFIFYQYFSVNVHREKIIAFDNPSGRVTVSMIAMEDLIKRVVETLGGIKDVRPDIKATRRGLKIKIRLALYSDVHIPDITARVQQLVARKIQESVGLAEPTNIEIYVGKIVSDTSKVKTLDRPTQDKPRLNVPFQGYRA